MASKKVSKPVTIPETLDGARKALGGLDRLLTATEWEKSAIVAAFVQVGEKHQNRHTRVDAKSGLLTPSQFAALGIAGLRSMESVRRYADAWESTGKRKPKPGQSVTLPTTPFKEAAPAPKYNGQSSPASIARALEDPDFAAQVARKASQKTLDNMEIAAMSEDARAEQLDDAAKRAEQAAKYRRKQNNHTLEWIAATGELNKARRAIKAAITHVDGVQFDDEETETLREEFARLEAAVKWARLYVTGKADVDWDVELAKLTGEEK